jgi:hypothetical protein
MEGMDKQNEEVEIAWLLNAKYSPNGLLTDTILSGEKSSTW